MGRQRPLSTRLGENEFENWPPPPLSPPGKGGGGARGAPAHLTLDFFQLFLGLFLAKCCVYVCVCLCLCELLITNNEELHAATESETAPWALDESSEIQQTTHSHYATSRNSCPSIRDKIACDTERCARDSCPGASAERSKSYSNKSLQVD